jgi:homoserine kinase
MTRSVSVRVPASTANLGPGFDCLGLALDLWNEADFLLEGEGLKIYIEGEGAGRLPVDRSNTVAYGFRHFLRSRRLPEPAGLKIVCRNQIPTGSGLGSSASALLLGFLAANHLSGSRASTMELLTLAADTEGHADNAAAALYGGLVVSSHDEQGWLVRSHAVPPVCCVIAVPAVNLPTHVARQVLPRRVSREDAVFNLSRTPMVVEALQLGDLSLLGRAVQDRLHQPYRFSLIPGAAEAFAAAQAAGAPAVAISGAGPSLIAFVEKDEQIVALAMTQAFEQVGSVTRTLILQSTNQGAQITQSTV